jgi:hypothetical protein
MSKKVNQIKDKKCVSWSPDGISGARLFVIEPWRKMKRKPLSLIRENDQIDASPFTFPCDASYIEPYFDYSTYVKPRPKLPLYCCCSSITNNERLPRSRTISLTEVYEIVEKIKISEDFMKKRKHSIDPLKERLNNDELDLCG